MQKPNVTNALCILLHKSLITYIRLECNECKMNTAFNWNLERGSKQLNEKNRHFKKLLNTSDI